MQASFSIPPAFSAPSELPVGWPGVTEVGEPGFAQSINLTGVLRALACLQKESRQTELPQVLALIQALSPEYGPPGDENLPAPEVLEEWRHLLSDWAGECEQVVTTLRRVATLLPLPLPLPLPLSPHDGLDGIVAAEFPRTSGPWDLAAGVEILLGGTGCLEDRPGFTVVRDYSGNGNVTARRTFFDRALGPLLENARQALWESPREDRKLTLRIRRGAQEYSVSVGDNGVGIPPANLARLFQPGFTTRKEGRGFGLVEAARAAAGFGGRIVPASDGVHLGATFTLNWREP